MHDAPREVQMLRGALIYGYIFSLIYGFRFSLTRNEIYNILAIRYRPDAGTLFLACA